jgi:hypothetical protein
MTDLESYGDFTYDPESRILRGLLLPFGEASRMNATGHEGVTFTADTIDLPRDPSVVTLNRGHDRHDPVGRATLLEKQDGGVYSEFQLADTDEADDWLSRQKDNLRKLSAEVRFAADKMRARLTGAALVTEGAFASAGLFALADDALAEEPSSPDTAHLAIDAAALPADITVSTPEGEQAVYTPEAESPVEDNQEGEFAMATSIVPDGVVTPEETTDLSASALFGALATFARTKDRSVMEPFGDSGSDALFAISNIQQSGPSTLTIGADVQVPQFIDEIWTRRSYQRKYVPLGQTAALTSL